MKRRRGLVIAIVIIVVVLGLGAAGVALYGNVVTSMLDVLRGGSEVQVAPLLTETVKVERGNLDDTVRVLGSVAAPASVSLTFDSDWGQVAEVLVQPGRAVKPGDALARLDAERLQQQVEQAQAALDQAEAQLKKAQEPLSELDLAEKKLAAQTAKTKVREEIEALKQAGQVDRADLLAAVNASRQKLTQARLAHAQLKTRDLAAEISPIQERYAPAAEKCAELTAKVAPNVEDADLRRVVCNETTDGSDEIARIQLSYERDLLVKANDIVLAERALRKAQQALDEAGGGPDALAVSQAENALAEAQAKQAAALEELSAAEAGPAPEALADKQAAVAQARRLLKAAQKELSNATLSAPVAGTVTKVGVAVGAWVDRSTVAAEVADLTDLRVVAAVDETEIGKLSADQAVRVAFDALPGQTFEGRVEIVPVQGTLSNDVLSFSVPVQLQEWPAGLRLGMTATLEVIVESVSDVLLVPAAAVQQMPDGQVVTRLYVDPHSGTSTPERVPVKTGRSNGLYMEIVEGLQEGDQVEVQHQAP